MKTVFKKIRVTLGKMTLGLGTFSLFTQAFLGIQALGVTQAFAAESAATTATEGYANSSLAQIVMLVAIGLIFYFMIFRPQNKRMKAHRDLVSTLQKGDEVLTSGGLLGKISRICDDFLLVSIAEGTEVMVQKQAIAAALPKGTMKSISS